MKLRTILSVSACLLAMTAVPTHAQISAEDKAVMASFAEPYGIQKGEPVTIYIPPTAHISEMVVYFDESDDTINGMFIYYQPDINSSPVRSNSVGKLEGKLIRVVADWNDVINGLEVETSPAGALASFLLTTEKGAKRGFQSSLANGQSKQIFGNNLQFAGLTVRADSEKVYAMGLNLVPASASSTAQNDSGIRVFSAGTDTVQAPSVGPTPAAPKPQPKKRGGFAQALNDFGAAIAKGKKDREFEEDQERLRKEQQAQRDRAGTNNPTSRPSSRPTSSRPTSTQARNLQLGGATKVILYEHCDYTGKSIALNNGSWDTATLRRLGMENDRVSSIKILNGMEIEASSNDYARGGVNKIFRSNVACLVDHDFNDVLSYAQIRSRTSAVASNGGNRGSQPTASQPRTAAPRAKPQPAAIAGRAMDADALRLGVNVHAILYSACNFRGKAIGIYEAEWRADRLTQLGFNGQNVSSIKLAPNKHITVQKQGRPITYKTDQKCISYPVHARPKFTSYTVKKQPALAFGTKPPAGTKARGPQELKWSSQGVTGRNVGAVYFESKSSSPGRVEITAEGSNIWNVITRGATILQFRVVRRTADSIMFEGFATGGRDYEMTMNLSSNDMFIYTYLIDPNSGQRIKLLYLTGKITHKSRPE